MNNYCKLSSVWAGCRRVGIFFFLFNGIVIHLCNSKNHLSMQTKMLLILIWRVFLGLEWRGHHLQVILVLCLGMWMNDIVMGTGVEQWFFYHLQWKGIVVLGDLKRVLGNCASPRNLCRQRHQYPFFSDLWMKNICCSTSVLYLLFSA